VAWTLAAPCRFEQDIKKSRFLAIAAPASDPGKAQSFIERCGEGDARHYCWAYRIAGEYRWNDAGEPAGTAGRPILAAIDGQQLDQVVVVVARWFGGIKLGAGGLVRAYGGSAAECLRSATRAEIVVYQRQRLRLDFDALGNVHVCLQQFAAHRVEERFDAQGVELLIDVRADQAPAFAQALRDATRGAIVVSHADALPQAPYSPD